MNRDTVIGLVGAVILVVAMVGVFRYERAQPETGVDAFTQIAAPGPTAKGTTNVGAKSDATLPVAKTNVTKAVFTVTWTANAGKDTVTLTVTPPAGVGNASTATS